MAKRIGQCRCTFGGLSQDFETGDAMLTLRVPRHQVKLARDIADNAKGLDLDLSLSKHSEKRTHTANSYFWVLCDKLAEATGEPKESIYQSYIKNIGGVSQMLCMSDKAVDRFREVWESNGIGWPTETFDSKLEGCTNVMAYYGSSTFDREQMARLIDLAVYDCKEQGIETKPPWELEALKDEWAK